MINPEDMTNEEIVTELESAGEKYHNGEESHLTDAEFDGLEFYLRANDPSNPYFVTIGAVQRGEKVDLPYEMPGLDQAYEGDMAKFVSANNYEDEEFLVSSKLDGNSGLVVYDANGDLKSAFSRGTVTSTGSQGADITRHMKKMTNGIPKKISGAMVVRVENILRTSDWEAIHAAMLAENGRSYKNSRNFGSGQLNKKVASDVFYKNVDAVAYEIIYPEGLSKADQMVKLHEEGFITPSWRRMPASEMTDEVLERMIGVMKSREDYALDGIVVELNNPELRKRTTGKNPTYAKKFKIGSEDNVATVKVVTVHWKASKHGYLKPRVEIVPVDLVGVTITYATGFNAKYIKEQGIGPGAVIQITRSGDVIPFIQQVITGVAPEMPGEEFGETVWSDNNVDLILAEGSDDVDFEKLKYFFGKLTVDAAGDGNIRKMFDAGYRTPADCVVLDEATWRANVGQSAGKKIFNSLQKRLNPVNEAALAAASGLFERGIGERKLQPVVDAFGGLNVSTGQLMGIEGIQTRTAQKIADGVELYEEFKASIAGFFVISEPEAIEQTSNELTGEYFVFTGIRDKELEEKLIAAGGEVGSSMSKVTTLIAKDPSSTSGKAQKARDAGVKIVSHNEAKEMV